MSRTVEITIAAYLCSWTAFAASFGPMSVTNHAGGVLSGDITPEQAAALRRDAYAASTFRHPVVERKGKW